MRIIITDRNYKEESLKKELHSLNMQLNSIIDHNKSMREEVATLKKDFKQKETKYLEDLLDMKALKEKVKDKLFKQDQSLQTVHMLCKPKPYYDENKKVAIGYKNPLYLTSAMQVQYALYNGHEILNTNHASAVVHDLEDTLELAEITRKRMLEKLKSPMCVEKKVKIVPLDYSKDNYLATFTPGRHLTPEQIFWSSNIQVLTLKPISKMTVYLPNTPSKFVPRVLPIKSQVKINIYTLTQLFTEFDKTCKKRITPCGLTKGKGVSNKQKNVTLLRFSELHAAYNVEQARIVDLEAEISNLKHKIEKDDYSEMIKHFSNLEIDHLNLQLKYQNLKESFGNNKSQTSQDTP
ncbi:hypothetical protein Tco_0071982 [Tanacetum coccineum]